MSGSIGYDSCGYPVKIPDDIKRHQETMQEMTNQLRTLQTELERKEEARLRQIIREEINAAFEQRDQRGLDSLLADISEPVDEQEEIAAVLATMTSEEWVTLVQRVKARKATE